jgi:hypothetical protein
MPKTRSHTVWKGLAGADRRVRPYAIRAFTLRPKGR